MASSIKEYLNYKKITDFNDKYKGRQKIMGKEQMTNKLIVEHNVKTKLRFVRIYFDVTTFDRITKDSAAKFVDKLSAIGGTMGLLTGFSIISGVEILYFAAKIIIKRFSK